MIADMFINETLNPLKTELFIRGRKLNIFIAFYCLTFPCQKILD